MEQSVKNHIFFSTFFAARLFLAEILPVSCDHPSKVPEGHQFGINSNRMLRLLVNDCNNSITDIVSQKNEQDNAILESQTL